MEKEYMFASGEKDTLIHAVEWLPEKKPVGVILIVHGITEHSGRYEQFARYFTERGFTVAAYDQIGHGKSVKSEDKRMCLSRDGWNHLVKDLFTNISILKKNHPDIPFYLLGFSLGSFVVRDFLNRYGNLEYLSNASKVSGVVLIGTGMQHPLVISLARKMVKKELEKGADQYSDAIDDMAFGNYNKHFQPAKTRFDWLCSSEMSLQKYMEDPLSAEHITPGYFDGMLCGMIQTGKKKNLKKLEKGIHFLVLSGQDDPVGEFGKGVKKYASALGKAGLDCKMKLYPGMRHDILHEDAVLSVYMDIENWLCNSAKRNT